VGLTLGLVGTDVNSGVQRFSFGVRELSDGVGVVVVAMGLFGIAEIVRNLQGGAERSGAVMKIESLWLTAKQLRVAFPAMVRGTAVGSLFGVLPGGGSVITAFASYALEKRPPRRRKSSARGPSPVSRRRNPQTMPRRRRRSFRS
jgi:TctA family transporter